MIGPGLRLTHTDPSNPHDSHRDCPLPHGTDGKQLRLQFAAGHRDNKVEELSFELGCLLFNCGNCGFKPHPRRSSAGRRERA